MIGSESFTVIRPNTYILNSAAGVDKVPTAQPPTGGSYLRLEGTGTVGNVVVTGVATDGGTAETILSTAFDTDKVAVSLKKWTSITKVTINSFTLLVIYPASSSGDKINFGSGSTTTFNIIADSYDTNLNQYRGAYQEPLGTTYKVYKTLMLDGRYTLQINDLITINGKQFKVADVESQHGLWSALLIIWR